MNTKQFDKIIAAKVDKPATLPQRSAAASRNEMATDIAAAESGPYKVVQYEGIDHVAGPNFEKRFSPDMHELSVCMNLAYAHGHRTANAELVGALESVRSACDAINENDDLLVEFNRSSFGGLLHDAFSKCSAALSKHGGQQ